MDEEKRGKKGKMHIGEKINAIIIEIYNFLIARRFINRNNRVCRRIRAVLYHNICYQCTASFGKLNPDRVFYLIRSPQAEMGFFGLYNYVVNELKVAENLNAEPVVDWQYYPNDYLSEDASVGGVNAWEYFFLPVSGVSLSEVYHSKKVIMSSGKYLGTLSEVEDAEGLLESNRLIRKYIHLNEKAGQLCEQEYKRLGMDRYRTLGVKCRGTDFRESRPKTHAICPDVEKTAEVISQKSVEWGEFDKIFLATEDEIMFEQMKEIYSDKLLYNQTERFKTANGQWLNKTFDRAGRDKNYKYDRMMEYLISVYLLSMCDALIAPVVGATLGAMRIKGKYEQYYLIHLGNYD